MAILRAAMVACRFRETRGAMQGHSHRVIVEGDASDTIDGIPVAYEGHKTSCGAVLMNGAANCSKQ
ncbi:hypothetical protein DBR44_05500 [Aquitalea sp. FJL05]|uniref:PAAR domain-containing protein n=1 Tax=Aquitalea sp. FJL05 TaxID=2153366 RepID=UPI000F5B5591|nr:PAAR domain-containing protein [Aquitalea sp. FJL05]RQO76142.1 hypothetical protein DBR44_05500 [Aquitalea sp. FJL05]